MKKNDKSPYYKDWTMKKLKAEAKAYYQTIYIVGCSSTRDIREYDAILNELDKRGVTPMLTF